MSKYNLLWEHLQKCSEPQIKMTFDEVLAIVGIPIDHSFLTYKKECPAYGYHVGKISMKEKNSHIYKMA